MQGRETSERPVYLWEALAPNAIAGFDFIPAGIGLATFESMEYPSLFSLREGCRCSHPFTSSSSLTPRPHWGALRKTVFTLQRT
jgi:hypothetical protein